MRTLRNSKKHSALEQRNLLPIDDDFENYEEILDEEKPQPSTPSRKRIHLGKPFRYMAVLLVFVLIGGSSIYALTNLRQGQAKNVVTKTTPQGVPGSSNENIASDSARINRDSYKEVNILVPVDSAVTIHSQPSIDALVLTVLNASNKAKEVTRQDDWVKVILQGLEGKEIEGWIDGDFVEEIEKKQSLDSDIRQQMVMVNDTPTGFLRVRKTPGGQELTKINPGEEYPLVKEQTGWIQIVLEDGTSGWVSKQYISSL